MVILNRAIPIACAAAIATLDIFAAEKLEARAASLSALFEQAANSLKDLPMDKDIRNIGLEAGIEFEAINGKPGAMAFATYLKCYGMVLHLRVTGDIIAISPPLNIEKSVHSAGEAGLMVDNYLLDEQSWALQQTL